MMRRRMLRGQWTELHRYQAYMAQGNLSCLNQINFAAGYGAMCFRVLAIKAEETATPSLIDVSGVCVFIQSPV